MGVMFCLSCALCVRCLHCSDWFKKKFAGLCVLYTVIMCTFTAVFFWAYMHPNAISQAHTDIGLMGGAGDGAGLLLGIILGVVCRNRVVDRWAQRRADRRRERRPPPRPAPPMLEVAPPPPLVEPHAEALPVAIGTVVGAAGIELQTDAPAMPPLVEMAKVLRRELGLASDMPIPGVVDAACRDLGVSAEGNLVERAARCWRAVRGTQTV